MSSGTNIYEPDRLQTRPKSQLRGIGASAAFETSATTAEYLTETIRENRPEFAPVITELLLQKAFDLASDQRQTHELKDLISSAIKLRELDLKAPARKDQLQRTSSARFNQTQSTVAFRAAKATIRWRT